MREDQHHPSKGAIGSVQGRQEKRRQLQLLYSIFAQSPHLMPGTTGTKPTVWVHECA